MKLSTLISIIFTGLTAFGLLRTRQHDAAAVPAIPVSDVSRVAVPLPTPQPTEEVAPDGVFYLVESAKVETDTGITGLPPGTAVKLVQGDTYLTPAGKMRLDPLMVTNNLAAARAARAQERTKQANAQTHIASEATTAWAMQRARDAETPTPQAQAMQLAPRVTARIGTSLGDVHGDDAYYRTYYYDEYYPYYRRRWYWQPRRCEENRSQTIYIHGTSATQPK